MGRKRIDMTGWIMKDHGFPDSMLTVIQAADDFVDKNGRHWPQWLCECSCDEHNKVIVAARDLTHKSHYTKSCGCLFSVSKRKQNVFDITSYTYGVGWTTNTNQKFYFDLEDYDKIKDYCWYELIDHTGYHTLCAKIVGTNKDVKMHHLLGFKSYDHIDRNPLNNRKNNLRQCTQSENAANRSIFKNNKSGITGVYFSKNKNLWIAQITVNSEKMYLGQFINKQDAIKTRLSAENKYFGEFAPQKHLFQQYNIIVNGE